MTASASPFDEAKAIASKGIIGCDGFSLTTKKEKMTLEEIKSFLSLQASFASHIKHANSFKLHNKIGVLDESNPFDIDRA